MVCLPACICHNKGREGEYPTLTIPCTNALRKVHAVSHWVISFCINTFKEAKDLMVGINSFCSSFIYRYTYYSVHVRKWNQQEMLKINLMADHSQQHNIVPLGVFQLTLKSRCWLKGFLDCSLCCSTLLFWAESWKFLWGILELTWRYLSLSWCYMSSWQPSCFQRCCVCRQEMVHCIIYAYINMDWYQ